MEVVANEKKHQLILHPETMRLWHVSPERVTVWDVTRAQITCQCDGVFVGISRNGRTFITHNQDNVGQAWDAAIGAEIPLTTLSPEAYDFHQRAILFPRRDINKATLEIRDLLGEYAPQLVFVGSQSCRPANPNETQEILQGWMLLSQRRLAVILWAVMGFDYTQGKLFDLDSELQLETFGAFLPGYDVLLFEQPDMMVSAGKLKGIAYDLSFFSLDRLTDPKRGETKETGSRWVYTVAEGNATCMSIHPQHPYEFAVLVQQTGFADEIHIYKPVPDQPPRQQKVAQTLTETGTVLAMTHHPNGRFLITYLSNSDIHIWDIEQGIIEQTLSSRPIEQRIPDPIPDEHNVKKNWERPEQYPRLIFHPDAPILWYEMDGQIHAWDIVAQSCCYTLPGVWVGHSQTGNSCLTLIDGDAHAWHSETGEQIALQAISSSDYDVDQQWVFRGQPFPAKVYGWNVFDNKQAVTIFPKWKNFVLSSWRMAPGQMRLFLAMVGSDEDAHAESWDLTTHTYSYQCSRVAWANHFYFLPDYVAIADIRTYQIYDTVSGEPIAAMEPATWGRPFAFHPQQEGVAAFVKEGEIRWGVWGRKLEETTLHPAISLSSWDVLDLCFSPDGRTIASWQRKGTIQLWDVETGALQQEILP